MIGSLFRVVLGFVLACLTAGIVKVLFALTPSDVFGGDSDNLSNAMHLATLAATHSAVFAAPFALVAAAIGEWQGLRNWTYYALVGIGIAIAGFIAQYQGESATDPTIANNYAFTTFITAGFLAGFVYWLFSGRDAGEAPRQPASVASRPAATPAGRKT